MAARPGTGSRATALTTVVVVAVLVGAVACAAQTEGRSTSAAAVAPCPVAAIDVVASVDQWGSAVRLLGGACTDVTSIVTGSTGDPHEYEPTAADTLTLQQAKVVVINGLGYDEWARKIATAASPSPVLVDAGAVAGFHDGDNPHIWYSPDATATVTAAVTAELRRQLPGAEAYLDHQAAQWQQAYAAVTDRVGSIRGTCAGKPYVATESVFDLMLEAVGLTDRTPEGFARAAANESEPAPGDLAAFRQVLTDGQAALMIANPQTESAVVEQLRDVAGSSNVPVVEVTETVPEGTGFVDWQTGELDALRKALEGTS